MNILITSASNKVWLIQAFKKALMKNGGGNVFAADIDIRKSALFFADRHCIIPKSCHPSFISELINLCQEENIQLIVPTRDGELKIFAENKRLLEKNKIKVMVANPDTINICQDKFHFYQHCINNNVNVVKTYLKNELSKIEFPVFVKPRNGSGSEKTYIAQSRKKLEQFLVLYDEVDFVIQPLIKLQEYTIDLFSDFNGNVISVLPRQRIEVRNGESLIGKIENSKIIIKHASQLAVNLKLIGHNTIQCFYDAQTEAVTFIEVNPRFGGGADLGFSAGILTPEYLIKLMNKNELKPINNNTIDELWMFKYFSQASLMIKDGYYFEKRKNKKTFCVDIDGTICTEYCRYEEALPVTSVIDKVNRLYNDGHTIILFTSRGYSSGYDWLPLLKQQMQKWGVLYHEIKQGKPYADFYVDNKAINILDWL